MSNLDKLKAAGTLFDEHSVFGRRRKNGSKGGSVLGERPSINAADSVMAGCDARDVVPGLLDKAIRWRRSNGRK